MPRVLMVEAGTGGRELADVEVTLAPNGRAALERMRRERFDAVVCDLGLDPLDGWCVLAAAGSWPERPRLVAILADAGQAGRARRLGADVCLAAGTDLHARALLRSTKETTTWPRPHSTTSRRPTRSGVSV